MQGVSRLLDSTDRFVKVLWGSHGGQQARSGTRGMELRRRRKKDLASGSGMAAAEARACGVEGWAASVSEGRSDAHTALSV